MKSVVFRFQLMEIYGMKDDALEEFFVFYHDEIMNTTPQIGMFKLMPILINLYNYKKLLHIVQMLIIRIFVKFVTQVPQEDYSHKAVNHQEIKSIMKKLFETPDRITRLALLQNVFYYDYIYTILDGTFLKLY